MVYWSLLDKIKEKDPQFRGGYDEQEYKGNLDDVLLQTLGVIDSGKKENDLLKLVLNPPRIIRALVDYKIEYPGTRKIDSLLKESIRLGLDIYSGDYKARQKIAEFGKRVEESDCRAVLKRKLEQPQDLVSWDATNPKRSENNSLRLNSALEGKPVLFIALGHGGVAAGMDTYLRYCDKSSNLAQSAFYVARFSAHKMKDTKPRLTPNEIAYLKNQVVGREAVLFDEDRATGKTLDLACRFFKEQVFPDVILNVVTNSLGKMGDFWGHDL